jgi:hypothetical protein
LGANQVRAGLSERGKWKLVEISEDQPPGAMLDMISVAEDRLKLIAKDGV